MVVFCSGMMVESIDFNLAAPVVLSTAHAYYGQGRRVARRTARRTARRVSRRHNVYRPVGPPPVVYGAGAVAATAAAVAIGTRVAALPGGCAATNINGITYYRCGGAYYQPVYDGPNVVYMVVNPPY
jgi:hypothetical protein